MNTTRCLATFFAVGALALVGTGPARAENGTAIVVVTAAPVTTTTTTSTTTTPAKTGAAITQRVVTCENAHNHGEWVSSQPKGEREAAAHLDCGKRRRSTAAIGGTSSTVTSSTALQAATSTIVRKGNDDQDDDAVKEVKDGKGRDTNKGRGHGNNGGGHGGGKGDH